MTKMELVIEKIEIYRLLKPSCRDSISRESSSSNKSSSKVLQQHHRFSGFHFQRSLLLFLSWILFAKVFEGQSHPIPLASSLPPVGIKGESEKFTLVNFQSKSEQTVATVTGTSNAEAKAVEVTVSLEENERRAMNNSSPFSTISGETERFDGESRLSRRQAASYGSHGGNYIGSSNRKSRDIRMSRKTNGGRRRRGFFDKGQEKQRLEEEYDRSFRLFWFLGGVAIVFFILIFILTLLCFCCPNLCKDKKGRKPSTSASIPRISIPTVDGLDMDGVGLAYQPSPSRLDVEMRMRSPSVISASGHAYIPHHRLSQEQVNAIQLQSQVRRNSALPSTSQGLLPASGGLMDVNVIQEYRPDVS